MGLRSGRDGGDRPEARAERARSSDLDDRPQRRLRARCRADVVRQHLPVRAERQHQRGHRRAQHGDQDSRYRLGSDQRRHRRFGGCVHRRHLPGANRSGRRRRTARHRTDRSPARPAGYAVRQEHRRGRFQHHHQQARLRRLWRHARDAVRRLQPARDPRLVQPAAVGGSGRDASRWVRDASRRVRQEPLGLRPQRRRHQRFPIAHQIPADRRARCPADRRLRHQPGQLLRRRHRQLHRPACARRDFRPVPAVRAPPGRLAVRVDREASPESRRPLRPRRRRQHRHHQLDQLLGHHARPQLRPQRLRHPLAQRAPPLRLAVPARRRLLRLRRRPAAHRRGFPAVVERAATDLAERRGPRVRSRRVFLPPGRRDRGAIGGPPRMDRRLAFDRPGPREVRRRR